MPFYKKTTILGLSHFSFQAIEDFAVKQVKYKKAEPLASALKFNSWAS